MLRREKERTAVFLDGSNLYEATKALGFDVDYSRLLKHYQDTTNLLRIFYYTAVTNDPVSKLRPLVDWLDYHGYTVVTKPTKEFFDPETGRTRVKGNMDGELSVDAMLFAEHIDHMVLFSGDGDYRKLVSAVQLKYGVKVTIVSTMLEGLPDGRGRQRSPMIADELRRQADTFVDLTELKPKIMREYEDTNERRQSMGRRST